MVFGIDVKSVLFVVGFPLVLLYSPPPVLDYLEANAKWQLAIFILIVQLPAFFTGHLSYVDIAWPCGLVAMAVNAFLMGRENLLGRDEEEDKSNDSGASSESAVWSTPWIRLYVTSGIMLFHGGRMALGAVMMFGAKTRWTYIFRQDLPRYQYAKWKYIEHEGGSTRGWRVKIQMEAATQGFVNCTSLVLPIALMCFDQSPTLSPVEVIGWVGWLISYTWENVADAQKMRFDFKQQKQKREDKKKGVTATQEKPVIGHPPHNTSEYSLWTVCRHPNYLGEFMCWVSLSIAAIPAVLRVGDLTQGQTSHSAVISFPLELVTSYQFRLSNCYPYWQQVLPFLACLLIIPLGFYHCLVWWTGAAPAEYFSVQGRPAYKTYQQTTPCLFPFKVPFVGQHMRGGWPHNCDEASARKKQ